MDQGRRLNTKSLRGNWKVKSSCSTHGDVKGCVGVLWDSPWKQNVFLCSQSFQHLRVSRPAFASPFPFTFPFSFSFFVLFSHFSVSQPPCFLNPLLLSISLPPSWFSWMFKFWDPKHPFELERQNILDLTTRN